MFGGAPACFADAPIVVMKDDERSLVFRPTRLASVQECGLALLPPSLCLFYFFTATRSFALRERGL